MTSKANRKGHTVRVKMSTESLPTNRSDGSQKGPGARGLRYPGRHRAGTGPGSFRDSSTHTGHAYLTAGHRSYREDKTTSYKSSTDAYMQKVPVQLENTYKMEPDTYFPQHKVETIIHDILKENLQEVQYDGALMGSKARMLSDLLKEKVKSLKMDRFKIISWVVICERQDNSLRIVSRELWDAQHDNFASVVFESTSLYAVGNVYAVYQE